MIFYLGITQLQPVYGFLTNQHKIGTLHILLRPIGIRVPMSAHVCHSYLTWLTWVRILHIYVYNTTHILLPISSICRTYNFPIFFCHIRLMLKSLENWEEMMPCNAPRERIVMTQPHRDRPMGPADTDICSWPIPLPTPIYLDRHIGHRYRYWIFHKPIFGR